MYRIITAGVVIVATAIITIFAYTQATQAQREQPHTYRNPKAEKKNTFKKSKRVKEIKEQIKNRTLKCAICLERCRFSQEIWFCNKCSNPCHISDCLIQWIDNRQSRGEIPECPSCRNVIKTPLKYTCMCGRQDNPKPDIYSPFSCGKKCPKCDDECHPGSCV